MALAERAIQKQRLARLRETLKAKAEEQITITESMPMAVNAPVPGRRGVCENPGCDEPIIRGDTGRRKRFCSDKCRNRVRDNPTYAVGHLNRCTTVFAPETQKNTNENNEAKASEITGPRPPRLRSLSAEERAVRALIEPDAKWPGMYRVRFPRGLSDMVNWSRAYDAAREFISPSD